MAGAFVHNYWGYTVLRFFAGIFGKGNFLVAFLIVMEIVGTKYKMYLGILITVGSPLGTYPGGRLYTETVLELQVFSSSGAMAVGLLAYLAEDWYNFQGLCAIMMFLLCIVAFFVPESPRSVQGASIYDVHIIFGCIHHLPLPVCKMWTVCRQICCIS